MKTILLILLSASRVLASDCDVDFIDKYLAKYDCFMNANQMECLRLGLTLGVASVGALGGVKLASLKKIPAFSEEFAKAQKLITERRNLADQAVREWENTLHDETKKMTRGEYKDYRTLERDLKLKDFDNETFSRLNNQKADAYKTARARIKQRIDANPGSEKSLALKGIYDQKGAMAYLDRDFRKQMAEIFPNEMAPLEPLYVERDALKARMSISRNNPNITAKLDSDLTAVSDKISKLTEKSLKSRLVDYLIRNSDVQIYSRAIMDLAKTLETDEKEQLQLREKKRKQRMATGGALGAASGLGVGMLWEAGEVYLGRTDLKRCQNEIGFSEEEIEVLSGRGPWEQTKLNQDVNRMNLNCRKLSLHNPRETIKTEFNEMGKLGNGTCQLIKNQDAALEKLASRGAALKDSECNLEDGKMVFVNSKNETFYVPYNEKTQWPNFLKADAKRNGKWDLASRKQFVEHYNSCRPATPVQTSRFDHWDIEQSQFSGVCSTEDDVKAVSCALKLRVAGSFESSEATGTSESSSTRAL